MSAITGGVTAATLAGGLAAASAGVGIASGIQGMTSDDQQGQQLAPGQYIPPSVTAKQANDRNAKILKAINKSIRKNNRYQLALERERHGQVREDIQWMRDQRASAAEIADPYIKERAGYIAKMRSLMDDPTSFLEKSPEYRARMAGGLEALTSQLAAKGLIGSGNVAIEAQALGAREASGQLGKDWERLAKLSGLMDANLGQAADIQAGRGIPIGSEYDPKIQGEMFSPAQSDQGFQLNPGQFVGPDYGGQQARQQGIVNLSGGLAGLAAIANQYQRQNGGGGYMNDQGYMIDYGR